jgi:hypothetical protein
VADFFRAASGARDHDRVRADRAAVMLPGFGQRHRDWMLRYPQIGVLTAMIHETSAA